ncbi:MAG: AAA family ATPase [Chlamydiia bacterium]|nr:AAA family ATPase [Chlamydiia bacterium]
MKKKLPTGIQSIKKILGDQEYVYVDKTAIIKEIIDLGAPHYFVSRPRRFGKSLFLDTLKEIFLGNKELFKECAIYKSDYAWEKHPVLYFDFSKIGHRTPEQLEASLKTKLELIAKEHDISIVTTDLLIGFDTLITELANKYHSKVVVLIDEYDKPIIDCIDDTSIANQNRNVLKQFFGTLKGADGHLKFTFFTGVSRFSHVSIFSGLNNLKNITMDQRYAAIMGYTEEELKVAFKEHIQAIIEKRGEGSEEDVIDDIRTWYNGYRFTKSEVCVYNPFSTLNYMDEQEFSSYWYSSGTPSFLINQVRKKPISLTSLRGKAALKTTLSDISNLDRINLSALMFQTGYLTIKGYNPEEDSYLLDFPNREVERAFFNSLLEEFAELEHLMVRRTAKEIYHDLESFNLTSFFEKINIHFAKVSYHLFANAQEGFYHAIFFTLLEASGIKTCSELATNIGRIDLASELPETIVIFELKLDQTADTAFGQAEVKKYKERYSGDGKNILVIGINFSSTSRNISDWRGELLSPSGETLKTLSPTQ